MKLAHGLPRKPKQGDNGKNLTTYEILIQKLRREGKAAAGKASYLEMTGS